MNSTEIRAKKIGEFILKNTDEEYVNDLLTAIDSDPEIVWTEKPPLSLIFEVICKEQGFTTAEIRERSKKGEKPFIRQLFIYLAVKIYDPHVLEAFNETGYWKAKMKSGLRQSLAEIVNRKGPTVSLSLLKVYNLSQVHSEVNAILTYFEELVYFEWVIRGKKDINNQSQNVDGKE